MVPGFTLIELLVVLAMMGIILTLVTANISGQQGVRNLKIAQSQLVTNLRMIQTYSLSSRALNSGQPVSYYFLKVDMNNPTQYQIQALYNATSNPQLVNLQTVTLPNNIRFAAASGATNPIQIDWAVNGATQTSLTPSCVLVAFKLPYSKALVNSGCNPANPTFPYAVSTGDDYRKFIDFIMNGVGSSITSDSTVILKLQNKDLKTSLVTINGMTGLITFSQ